MPTVTIKSALILGLCLLACIIGLDVWLALDSTKGNTWSEIIRTWSRKTLLLPWAWGVLAGHWFHWFDARIMERPGSIVLLLWTTIAIGIVSTIPAINGSYSALLATLVMGFLSGAFFWSP
jgi:hypothetical protein